MGDIFKWQHIKLSSLHNFGSDWSMMPSGDALVSIDNHDNQRGHGAGGNVITHKQPEVSILLGEKYLAGNLLSGLSQTNQTAEFI